MKRILAIMALAAVMAFSLAACGMGSDDVNRSGRTDADTAAENPVDNSGAAIYDSMADGWKDRSIRRSDPAVAIPDPERVDAANRSRYELMLDNARVRDTDGFLFDGENPQHNTF